MQSDHQSLECLATLLSESSQKQGPLHVRLAQIEVNIFAASQVTRNHFLALYAKPLFHFRDQPPSEYLRHERLARLLFSLQHNAA